MKKITLLFILFAYTYFTFAQVAPKNILLQKCLFSYAKIYKILKGHKAFAYARVSLGEKDYCAWSQETNNVENARKFALNGCKQAHIDAPCKIIDIDNKWLVQEEDFSRIEPPDNTPLSQKELDALTSKTKNILVGKCIPLFQEHLHHRGHKVFAYSIDKEGQYACATAKEQETLRQAAIIALDKCEKKRTSMEKKAPKHRCLSLSDGRNILIGARDFNLTLNAKSNLPLSIQKYQDLIQKATPLLSDACLSQYKYYLRGKEHKAFYVAKDVKGNSACGQSINQFTIKAAKAHALTQCHISAKVNKVKTPCTLFSLNLRHNE